MYIEYLSHHSHEAIIGHVFPSIIHLFILYNYSTCSLHTDTHTHTYTHTHTHKYQRQQNIGPPT